MAAVLAVVMAAVGAFPGAASASSAPHRPARHGAHAVPGAGLTLAQAPAGLRSAVRRTLGTPAVAAGSAFQKAKLTASDGLSGDNFGYSVAIAGSTAVVGAYGNNLGRGAAYVFTRSGSTWTQQAKLTAADGAPGDNFGFSVAIAGSTAVVGAYGTNSFTGAAYVFTRSGGTWTQQAELTASDGAANDLFGDSVAIAGSTAVVGAYGNNSSTGAAYVFTRSGTTWTQQAELTASDGAANDFFGSSVALSGSTAVVSATGKNSSTGVAYVFTRSGTTWTQQAELTAPDGADGDNFGFSVTLSGSTAVVGAPSNQGTGAAYVFTRSGTAWTQQAKPTAADGAANDLFGWSVALSGSTAVVGAYGSNGNTGAAYVFGLPSQQARLAAAHRTANANFGISVAISGSTAVVGADTTKSKTGAAYVFTRSGSTWTQQAKLTAADGARNDFFGVSVAISGSTAVVGADGKKADTGAAYVFTRSGSTWTQQAKLTGPGGTPGDQFAFSVALSGSTALIGAGGKNSATGAAYVFTRSGSTWTQQAKLTGPGGTPGDQFGVSVALSGSTAVIGAIGKNSATGAAYVFTRSGSTWTQQAELTASDGTANDLFGDSVAISGTTAMASAPGKNSFTGAAYVFTRSGSTWTQQAELTGPGGIPGDEFGVSVALSGSTAVIGADGKNVGAGAAYVFTRSGSTWTQQAELTASDGTGADNFGFSVALSGSTAVAGAPFKNSSTGAAYAFANV